MIDRILRIIKLDFSVFRDIESDPAATVQAAIVVVVASGLSAVGTALSADTSQALAQAFLGSFITGVVGWLVWSAVTHFVGKALYQSGGTLEEMLRVVGYANAPRFLGIFSFIPCLGALAGLAGLILSLIAVIMAISEGLDVSTGQAIIVAVVGLLGFGAVMVIVSLVFGLPALLTYGLCAAAAG
jgi:hypothetical protein